MLAVGAVQDQAGRTPAGELNGPGPEDTPSADVTARDDKSPAATTTAPAAAPRGPEWTEVANWRGSGMKETESLTSGAANGASAGRAGMNRSRTRVFSSYSYVTKAGNTGEPCGESTGAWRRCFVCAGPSRPLLPENQQRKHRLGYHRRGSAIARNQGVCRSFPSSSAGGDRAGHPVQPHVILSQCPTGSTTFLARAGPLSRRFSSEFVRSVV